jgi:TetR/AcrR family transcriptional repressor of nem operon
MARTREFDPDQALQAAIDVFWKKGYFDATVDEVVRRSGVAKYGIYGTFGNKDELFKKALEQYALDRKQGISRILFRENAALPELRKFFGEAVKAVTQEGHRYGCLLCNTAMEVGAENEDFQSIVRKFFTELAQAMRRCLKRAVLMGQLDHSRDTAQIANYLATEFRTILMLSRSGESRRAIQEHVQVVLSVLD